MKTYVYFIRDHNDGLIKIGFSANVHRRMRSFGSSAELIGCVHGGWHEEQRIHGLFKAYRVYSEWFNDHPDIRAFIAANTIGVTELYTLFAPYVRRNRRRREFPEKAPERQRSVPVLSPEAQARLDASIALSESVRASMHRTCECGHCHVCRHRERMRRQRAEQRLARIAAA